MNVQPTQLFDSVLINKRYQRILCRILVPILMMHSELSGAQVAPLSYAAVGVSTAVALNKADEVATNAINRAGSVASLTSAKIAQDIQLLIANARQNF